MTRPDVLVAVPARNEESTIANTLGSVVAALTDARDHGLVGSTHVEVAAHRCRDHTADRARTALATAASGRVLHDDLSATVADVRHNAVLRGLELLGGTPGSTWVLSTDADTVVGPDWVRRILGEAAGAGAVAVVGLADLDSWQGAAEAESAYRSVIASKMRDVVGLRQHDHVYGANLAVRADAYLACGGFTGAVGVTHGEDQALVDRLASRGHRVARTVDVRVRTSGRLDGRADLGLAAHLRRLHLSAEALPVPGTA